MKHHKLITFAVVGALILATGVYLALRIAHASYGYTVAAEFASLPPDDTALVEWLRTQKGIAAHTIHTGRSGQRLKIFFIMSQDFTGHPRLPDLDGACARLGYTGQIKRFTDYRGQDKDTF